MYETQYLPLPDRLDYQAAVTMLDDGFHNMGGVRYGIGAYRHMNRHSPDFAALLLNFAELHALPLEPTYDRKTSRVLGGDLETARATIGGFVVADMIASQLHPPVWPRMDRFNNLALAVDVPIHAGAEVLKGGGIQQPRGRRIAWQAIADAKLAEMTPMAMRSLKEWSTELVTDPAHREDFVASIGVWLSNAYDFHARVNGQLEFPSDD